MKPPSIPDAKKLAYELRAKGAIVLAFDGKQVGGASFGHTRAFCDDLRAVLDAIMERLTSGEIPVGLPKLPWEDCPRCESPP